MGAGRIAVVGCGAIAESYHLPALAEILSPDERVVLVDPRRDRLEELGRRFGAAETAHGHAEILGRVDGAILAVPAHLHHELALEFLDRDTHVLCEKPLARTSTEVDELLAAAEESGGTLSVNNNRRLFPSMQKVAELVRSEAFGRPVEVEFVLGEVFDWPAAGNSYFGPDADGRGVLLDIGAHVIDLLCWWLGGEVEVESYADDAQGGTEAVADLSFTAGDCRGRVRLSWLSRLNNRYRIGCKRGSIEGGVYDLDRVRTRDARERETTLRIPDAERDRAALAERMLRNFVAVVDGLEEPLIPAGEVAGSIRVIDRCYRNRRRMDLPWLRPDEEFLRV